MTMLALLGGKPEVDIPQPHFRWPLIGEDEERAVLAQLRSGQLSLSRRAGVIEQLENEFAAQLKLPFALSTCSGTAALHAAYFGLDLEPGDEVLAPAYTHLGSVFPMLHANLIPVLCDVSLDTGNIDASDAGERVTPRTRAIVVTHQYGHACDMPAVLSLARRHDLRIVEDCSHAHGATLDGRPLGSFGEVACFSLQGHKTVVAGEGGILVTRHPHLFERAALLGHFRERNSATSEALAGFVETGYGLKNRLHPLGAAVALEQLRKLPRTIAGRRENLEYFTLRLKDVSGVEGLPTAPGVNRGGYFRFLVRYRPDQLGGLSVERYVQALKAEGVSEISLGSLAKPLHLTRLMQTAHDHMFRNGWPRNGAHVGKVRVYASGDFPRAERFSFETLQFPAFTEPSKHIIDAYCRAMNKVAAFSSSLLRA